MDVRLSHYRSPTTRLALSLLKLVYVAILVAVVAMLFVLNARNRELAGVIKENERLMQNFGKMLKDQERAVEAAVRRADHAEAQLNAKPMPLVGPVNPAPGQKRPQ